MGRSLGSASVLEIVQNSDNSSEAKYKLKDEMNLMDIQADAVLSIGKELNTLAGFFGEKVIAEVLLAGSKAEADAIKKGSTYAQKNMVEIPVKGDTIAHDVEAKFGGTIVMLKPAPPGTGVIAGEAVRAVVELAGVKDVVTKVRRSTNPTNVVKATLKGLQMLKDPDEEVARRKEFVDKKKYESRTLEEISE